MGNKFNELSNFPSDAFLSSNKYTCPSPPLIRSLTISKQKQKLAIVELGASGYFLTKDAPKKNMDPTESHIQVGTASGQPMTSAGTFDLVIPQLPSDLPITGHVMPGFQDNLVCVGTMGDANCTVTF